MKVKFLIMGRTASGKDYLTNYICDKFKLKQLKSYATRPMRYENEDTHIFITPEQSKEIQSTQDVIAYTKIGEYEYFGTYEQFMESDIYIIDPNGAKWLKDKYGQKLSEDGIKLITLYIYANDSLRLARGVKRDSDIAKHNKRNMDEFEQFSKIEYEGDYDFFVGNIDYELAKQTMCNVITINKLYYDEKEGK